MAISDKSEFAVLSPVSCGAFSFFFYSYKLRSVFQLKCVLYPLIKCRFCEKFFLQMQIKLSEVRDISMKSCAEKFALESKTQGFILTQQEFLVSFAFFGFLSGVETTWRKSRYWDSLGDLKDDNLF